MPLPRKSVKAGKPRVIRKTLADGTTREYHYGPRLRPKRQRAPADTLEALIKAFEDSPEYAAKAPATRQQYAIYLRPWAKVGHLRVKDIRRKHILTIRDAIAASRGNGAATAFGRVAGALFGWAVDREWIEASPAHRIKPLGGGSHRAWTDAEAERAKQELPSHLARVVELGEIIGQRRLDMCRLRWSDYDGRAIRLTQSKTGAEVVLPLPTTARAMLDRWQRSARAETILTNASGKPWTPGHLSREMKRELERIGMREAGARGPVVHGLRKRTATRIADAGGSAHQIKAVTGHKTLAMVAHYTDAANQERLAESGMEKLEFAKRRKPAGK